MTDEQRRGQVERLALACAAALALTLTLGCAGKHEPGRAPASTPSSLDVFAGEPFYMERQEPEWTLRGVLRAKAVREGPNTRDMPFVLVVGEEQLSVYASGFDERAFLPFVEQEIEVVGKRIDLRGEGYGVEIWIASMRSSSE